MAVSVLASLVAGCGMALGQQGDAADAAKVARKEVTAEPTAASAAAQPPADQPTAVSAAESPVAVAQEPTVIASRKVVHEDSRLRIDITGLKRQGRIVTLTWTITNLGDPTNTWSAGADLGAGGYLDFTVSGVALIDPVNGRRYRVARNGTGENAQCVCTGRLARNIRGGESLQMYAVYGAPPPDVTKVNVEFPSLGVFTDVPIS